MHAHLRRRPPTERPASILTPAKSSGSPNPYPYPCKQFYRSRVKAPPAHSKVQALPQSIPHPSKSSGSPNPNPCKHFYHSRVKAPPEEQASPRASLIMATTCSAAWDTVYWPVASTARSPAG